jgi:ribosomal peptide maturation radical SAM protein 1
MKGYEGLLGKADVLIIIPPFIGCERPSIAAHLLKACAQKAGFSVEILYANISLAAFMGEKVYLSFWSTMQTAMGERFFSRTAYGLPAFGFRDLAKDDDAYKNMGLDPAILEGMEEEADSWIEVLASDVVSQGYKVVGLSSTFEQTSASIAIINRIKQKSPETITILGGANCHGEMAEGLADLSDKLDYVFSGDSEETFSAFLDLIFQGNKPENKIIRGKPCMEMDSLPYLDYSEYYRQVKYFLPESVIQTQRKSILVYETSRGCWWGEKSQCNFCGMNGSEICYRSKSPARVLDELKQLLAVHPSRTVATTDSVIPNEYFKTLVAKIPTELPDVNIAYEIRTNTSYERLKLLRDAGINTLQPGIEALSTSLLKRMNKGVLARHNLAFLRYARILNINANWNLIYQFPGDTYEEYCETFKIIRMIRHFQPPLIFTPMSIDRFSPYFMEPGKFGIKNIRPLDVYSYWLPKHIDTGRIAYHFSGDYESFSSRDNILIKEISSEVKAWIKEWEGKRPQLHVEKISEDSFLLIDSRGIAGVSEMNILNKKQALAVLTDRTKSSTPGYLSEETAWALENRFIYEVDNYYISLVTASTEIFEEIEGLKNDRHLAAG